MYFMFSCYFCYLTRFICEIRNLVLTNLIGQFESAMHVILPRSNRKSFSTMPTRIPLAVALFVCSNCTGSEVPTCSVTCFLSAASTQNQPRAVGIRHDLWATPHSMKTVGRICKSAGIPGHKTNHSLCATTATRLYQSGVDEQLVMERLGHRSLDVVRSYKQTSASQREALSDIQNRQGAPSTVSEWSAVSVQSSQNSQLLQGLSFPFSHCSVTFNIGCVSGGEENQKPPRKRWAVILDDSDSEWHYTAQNCSCYQHIYLLSSHTHAHTHTQPTRMRIIMSHLARVNSPPGRYLWEHALGKYGI